MTEDSISTILIVYNQEDIIQNVASGIANNISELTKEVIIVLDGCTDKTEENLDKVLPKFSFPIKIIETPNLNEVKANNVGLKNSTCKYSILLQDDIVITEPDFDKRMLKPFKLIDNLFAVGGRTSQDTRLINNEMQFYNTSGKDVNTARNIFAIRDTINRSPFMVDNEKMKELNYFDEDFAPLTQDDADVCFRAYRKGWIVGAYAVDYDFDLSWGTTRKNYESMVLKGETEKRNLKMLVERHRDLIESPKHSRDIIIE
jgi:glycosyltransferase involved in cell wall biosynthesis